MAKVKRLGRLGVLVIAFLVFVVSTVCASGKEKVVYEFEKDRDVRQFSPYIPSPATGWMELTDEEAKVGEKSVAIHYSVPAQHSFVLFYAEFFPFSENWSAYSGISVWIYGDDSNNVLEYRCLSGGYEKMAIMRFKVNWSGWKEVHLDFDAFEYVGDFKWSEVTRFEILITNRGDGFGDETVVYLDELKAVELLDQSKIVDHLVYE